MLAVSYMVDESACISTGPSKCHVLTGWFLDIPYYSNTSGVEFSIISTLRTVLTEDRDRPHFCYLPGLKF